MAERAAPLSQALLTTKLFPPPSRPALVPRPRLIRQLDNALALNHKLALISAPAGFGKTTIVSEWLSDAGFMTSDVSRQGKNRKSNIENRKYAWLGLDGSDNDPVRFFTYFIRALAPLTPAPQALESLLPQFTSSSFAPETFGAQVLGIFSARPLPGHPVLVLDDYHVIQSPALHQFLAQWLDHSPPNLTLCLTTRADPPLPLARLRARAQLTELRAADLRFTPDEAAAFLNTLMGLQLTAAQIAALDTRTEGWIAGLQLAALSMRGRADVDGFLRAFTGSHRYIVEYLTEEVLHRQPAPLAHFLLSTCILDRMNATVCRAVTGDGDSGAMLQQLERSNLFLQPLDDEREWYRYHQLFADVLRLQAAKELGPALPALHRRAADAFHALDMPDRAIHHALSAQATGFAAELAEQYAQPLLNRGEYATVRGWLDALPAEERRSRPRLGLASAAIALLNHRLDETDAWLESVTTAANTAQDSDASRAVLSEVAAMRAGIAINENDLPRTITLAREALAGLPAGNLRLRGLVTFYLGLALTWSYQRPESIRLFAEARELSDQAGDINTALTALLNQGAAEHSRGKLREAFRLYQQLLDLAAARKAAHMPIVALTYANMGYAQYEWNDLESAAANLQESIERGETLRTPRTLIFSYLFMARLLQTRGEPERALELIQKAEQLVTAHNLPQLYASELAAYRVCLWLAQGNLDAAFRWADSTPASGQDELDYLHEAEAIGFARVLVARARPGDALELLFKLRHQAESSGQVESLVKILALEAVALSAKQDSSLARATLARVLTLAAPEHYVRTFADEGEPIRLLLVELLARSRRPSRAAHLDPEEPLAPPLVAYATELLTAFPPPPERALPLASRAGQFPSADPITPREIEVLHLIDRGFSNPEIAAHLHVEISTVKKHINNLFSKLDAKTRTQALLRAREQGLIP